ncbi:MAG: lysophospholipase [Desulfobacterota bacterium]|nr:lysophospholipase [Thermodesulfobacteriota bacterium]
MEKYFVKLCDRTICAVIHKTALHPRACVVTCHGLFSSKDSNKFITIAEQFSAADIMVIRFDFSGCGESSGDISETTVTRRLEELETVISFFKGRGDINREIFLLGSSLGGYVAALYAASHAVAGLSLWATPFDLLDISQRIPENEIGKLKQDFFYDARRWHFAECLGRLSRVQIIHGTHDTIVPAAHAKEIYGRVNHPKELIFLPSADHSFICDYHRQEAVTRSLAWFLHFLTLYF